MKENPRKSYIYQKLYISNISFNKFIFLYVQIIAVLHKAGLQPIKNKCITFLLTHAIIKISFFENHYLNITFSADRHYSISLMKYFF